MPDTPPTAVIIGTAPGLSKFMGECRMLPAPPFRLVGSAHTPQLSDDIPFYETTENMANALPDVDIVLLFAPEFHEEAREHYPSAVLYTPRQLPFLCEMLRQLGVAGQCSTDLEHTRTLFETIINEIKEDIILLDTQGRIVDVNDSVWQRRHMRREDFIGIPFWEVLDEQENLCRLHETDCPFSTTLHTGKMAEALYTLVDKDSRLHYYRVYTYPIFDPQGNLTHIAELRRDISERKHLEQRLQQSERLAAIGELSTYFAHEIRNPLFAISGFANSLLKNGDLSEKARTKVEIILAESHRLDSTLKSLISFTRPTEADTIEVDLGAIVDEVMPLFTLRCQGQGISVHINLSEDKPHANADTELLKQCLINLVRNAIEAMPRGGDLTVTTGSLDGELFIRVEDTGVGIPPENMEKVFNPFFSTHGKGAGLGLAMIKKIIDDLGGDVVLESKVGQGTTVTLKIPPVLAVPPDIVSQFRQP